MLNENKLRTANALMLRWHSASFTIDYEAFQAWSLTSLKPALYFDGAVWGVMAADPPPADPSPADPSPAGPSPIAPSPADSSPAGPRVSSAHLHHVDAGALAGLELARSHEFAQRVAAGLAVNTCVDDFQWQGAEHSALRDHARRWGLSNVLFSSFDDVAAGGGRQFLMLARADPLQRFSGDEMAAFELLAPHMMQAYAIRRRLFLDKSQNATQKVRVAAVAIVDRAGFVHDHLARFATMMRREWSDWPGRRLPEPLLALALRRAGEPWLFLGEQVSAEFLPVDDVYVVMARPRHGADVLTAREGEVAQRYAAGGSFREVAESLNLSPATVRSHLRNVFGKLQIRNKAQLAAVLR